MRCVRSSVEALDQHVLVVLDVVFSAVDQPVGELPSHRPVQRDRPIVVDITKRIAQRYKAYVSSGSQVWRETLDTSKLPSWLLDAGEKGAIAMITGSTDASVVQVQTKKGQHNKVFPV